MMWGMYAWVKSRLDEVLDQRGITAAEYALLLVVLVAAIATGVGVLSGKIQGALESINFPTG